MRGPSVHWVQGAVGEGGRGQSIWDTFSATPGKTHQGQTGAVADDFYHRYLQVGAARLLACWLPVPSSPPAAVPTCMDMPPASVDNVAAKLPSPSRPPGHCCC